MRGLYLSMYRSAGDQQRESVTCSGVVVVIWCRCSYRRIDFKMCVFVPVFLLVRCTSRLIAEGRHVSRVRE